MEIWVLNASEQSDFDAEVLSMLREADAEFVPPLSARSSTTQKNLTACCEADGVEQYFEGMKHQRLLVAAEDGEMLGFVSFLENYTCDMIGEEECPNIYISTLIVRKTARGMGLTRKMYGKLFDIYKDVSVFTRTWSQNGAHIKNPVPVWF